MYDHIFLQMNPLCDRCCSTRGREEMRGCWENLVRQLHCFSLLLFSAQRFFQNYGRPEVVLQKSTASGVFPFSSVESSLLIVRRTTADYDDDDDDISSLFTTSPRTHTRGFFPSPKLVGDHFSSPCTENTPGFALIFPDARTDAIFSLHCFPDPPGLVCGLPMIFSAVVGATHNRYTFGFFGNFFFFFASQRSTSRNFFFPVPFNLAEVQAASGSFTVPSLPSFPIRQNEPPGGNETISTESELLV